MTPRIASVVLALALVPGAAAAAGDMSDQAKQGQAIVRNACSSCHATELDGASRNPQAPPFREVAKRYPPEDLSEALAEGIDIGHPEMPEFVFEPDAIGAIIAYLDWLGAHAQP